MPRGTRERMLQAVRAALRPRYGVDHEIGHGGMASVYAADDRERGCRVAIKVLRPEFAVTLIAERFHREVEYLSELHHPNILPVLDSGAAEDILYFTMPFAHGASLRHRLDTAGPLPIGDTCHIARDIAAALDHAHEHNIVHRDIKPENVVFDGGRTAVCDFGIARAIVRAGGDRLSSSGLIVGTPQYMSPEQGGGEDVSSASDIYALGCVTFEMLIGEAPFDGPNPQTIIARHVREKPPQLRVVRREIPEGVQATVEWALRKAPGERPDSGAAFADALLEASGSAP